MPGAPFVHHQLHLVLLVVIAHGQPVLGHQRVHHVGLPQHLVPLVGGKFEGVAFARGPAVIVHRQAVEPVKQIACSCPPDSPGSRASTTPGDRAGRSRARPDEAQLQPIVGNPGGEAAKLHGVFFRPEVAAAAPGLIADAPISHVVGFAAAVAGARLGQRGAARGRVAILHPFVEIVRGQAADVGGQVRLVRRRVGRSA